MRRHHTGSGRATTVVVPDDWAAHAAGVVEGFMTEATISLRQPGETTAWDSTAKATVPTPYAAFATDVPARVQAITESAVTPSDEAAEAVRVLGYRISIPAEHAETGLQPGAVVTIQTCSDPQLVDLQVSVSDVVRGTHRFERDLICLLND